MTEYKWGEQIYDSKFPLICVRVLEDNHSIPEGNASMLSTIKPLIKSPNTPYIICYSTVGRDDPYVEIGNGYSLIKYHKRYTSENVHIFRQVLSHIDLVQLAKSITLNSNFAFPSYPQPPCKIITGASLDLVISEIDKLSVGPNLI